MQIAEVLLEVLLAIVEYEVNVLELEVLASLSLDLMPDVEVKHIVGL